MLIESAISYTIISKQMFRRPYTHICKILSYPEGAFLAVDEVSLDVVAGEERSLRREPGDSLWRADW